MNVRRALRQDGVEDYIINSNARASQGVIWVKDSGIFRRLSRVIFALSHVFLILIFIFLMVSFIFLLLLLFNGFFYFPFLFRISSSMLVVLIGIFPSLLASLSTRLFFLF